MVQRGEQPGTGGLSTAGRVRRSLRQQRPEVLRLEVLRAPPRDAQGRRVVYPGHAASSAPREGGAGRDRGRTGIHAGWYLPLPYFQLCISQSLFPIFAVLIQVKQLNTDSN